MCAQTLNSDALFPWVHQLLPQSLVELGAPAYSCSFPAFALIEKGWRALIVTEGNEIPGVAQRWRARSDVLCTSSLAAGLSVPLPDSARLVDLFSYVQIPKNFGILILNQAQYHRQIIEELRSREYHPEVIVLADQGTEPIERAESYEALLAIGYRFSGMDAGFSIFSNHCRPAALHCPTYSDLSRFVTTESGMVCFDEPQPESDLLPAGERGLKISGWAISNPDSPVPPSVIIELCDLRTGQLEYVDALRVPRLDVSWHFGKPNLLMSGFRAIIPMRRHYPNGIRVRVLQCEGNRCLAGSTVLDLHRGTEDFEHTARLGLARKFLRGAGIEIGALQRKLELPATCSIRYLDRMRVKDLLQHYPELKSVSLQAPDFLGNGERIDEVVCDNSLDFVIANHFFEHCENPVDTLQRLLNALRPGGIVFLAVPDKRYTFDAGRPSTSNETLRTTFQTGVRADRLALYEEWVEFVELKQGEQMTVRAKDLARERYSIHFNVWTADELLAFFFWARGEFGFGFGISSVVCSDNECIVLLERKV